MTILLILCGFAAGLSESTRLRMRSRELAAFVDALASMKSAAAYTSGDLHTLLTLGAENPFLSTIESEKDPVEAWKKAADDFFTNSADRSLAQDFINGYGRTDLSGLLAHLSLFEEKAAAQLSRAEKAVETKSRLYTVLGLFIGTTAALLLI